MTLGISYRSDDVEDILQFMATPDDVGYGKTEVAVMSEMQFEYLG